MQRGEGPMIGIALEGVQHGERVTLCTKGADEVPLDSEIANAHVHMLVAEAIKAGARPPAEFLLGGIQVFYRRGRPVEARLSGRTRKVGHYADDGQPVWLFPPWSTDPAPQWAEDGGMLAVDAARTHQAARSQLRMAGSADPQPVFRRWWNLHEHSPQAFVFWRDLADLAESEDDFPLALQGVTRFVLGELKKAENAVAGYALSEAGASWRDKLVRRVKARLAELRKAAGLDGETPPENEAGAEVAEKAAGWMAETFALDGTKSAEDLRERAKPHPWTPWWPEGDADFAFVLRRLAFLVWRNEVEAEAERERTAPVVSESALIGVGGYGGVPRILAPMSWAFGGPAIAATTVNGDAYAMEPRAAESALVPRSWSRTLMLTPEAKQPERFNLPLELDEPMPLAIQVTDATGYALTPHAGKVALLLMAQDRALDGRLRRWTIDSLVKSLNPGGKRIESSHYKPVAEALEMLKKMHAFLPTGQKWQVFYANGLLTDPKTAYGKKQTEVILGIDPAFCEAIRQWGGAPGYFLINLDGVMRLDNRKPVALRTYVRVAALWNTRFLRGGEPNIQGMTPTHIDQIGLMANNYRAETARFIQAQGQRSMASRARKALSEDREATRGTLKELAADGLLTLEEKGKHELLILPPGDYLEAWRLQRQGPKDGG